MTDHPDDDDHNHNGMSHYSTQAITPLSKALQEIYKLGGWALVLMLTFLVLVFAAFFLAKFWQSTAGYVAFSLAAAILAYFGIRDRGEGIRC